MADAPKINPKETLRESYPKLNQAIDNANEAIKKATTSDVNAAKALTTANSVQEQFNQVVIEGDSSVEAAQARVSSTGTTYTTLKERLDQEHESVTTQLAEIGDQIDRYRDDSWLDSDFAFFPTYREGKGGTIIFSMTNDFVVYNELASVPASDVFGISGGADYSMTSYNGYFYMVCGAVDTSYNNYAEHVAYGQSNGVQGVNVGSNRIRVARSRDLKSWENWWMDIPSEHVIRWAPEWFLDPETNEMYMLISLGDARSIVTLNGFTAFEKSSYYIKFTNDDLTTWEDPIPLTFTAGSEESDITIDLACYSESGTYYFSAKDDGTKSCMIWKTNTFGQNLTLSSTVESQWVSFFEGSAIVKFKNRYYLNGAARSEKRQLIFKADTPDGFESDNCWVLQSNSGEYPMHFTPYVVKANSAEKNAIAEFIKEHNPRVNFNVPAQRIPLYNKTYTKLTIIPNAYYTAGSDINTVINDVDTELMNIGDEASFNALTSSSSIQIPFVPGKFNINYGTNYKMNLRQANTGIKHILKCYDKQNGSGLMALIDNKSKYYLKTTLYDTNYGLKGEFYQTINGVADLRISGSLSNELTTGDRTLSFTIPDNYRPILHVSESFAHVFGDNSISIGYVVVSNGGTVTIRITTPIPAGRHFDIHISYLSKLSTENAVKLTF